MKSLFTFLLASATCFSLNAQLRFEQDFNTRERGSSPQWVTAFDGRVFFSAEDGYSGRELWTYDPALDEAYQLGNLNPQSKSAQPRDLTVLGDELFFVIVSDNEQQLQRIAAGGTQAEQLFSEQQFSRITNLTIYDGALYFKGQLVNAEWHETELYRYQPDLGTLEIVVANRGDYVLNNSFQAMQVHQDKLYLSVLDTVTNNLVQLMSYDAATDEFTAISNQYTENGQQIYVTDMRSLGEYLILNIRNPESLNKGYLGVYLPGVDSFFIDLDAELWTANPPSNRSIEVVGERLYLRLRGDRTLLRTYDLASREVQTIQEVADFTVFQMQELDGQLLYTTFPNFSTNEYVFRIIDPITNVASPLADFPTLQPRLVGNYPGNTFNYFASLGGNWYYQGFSAEDNGELHRFDPDQETDERITDIHLGNVSGQPVFSQVTANGTLLIRISTNGDTRDVIEWVEYQPADRSAERLLPELDWDFYGKVYQLPGYLIAANVTYDGVDYAAVAYDSSSQTIIPIVEAVNNCDGGFARTSGTFVAYNNAVYFSHCDGERIQLYRHEFGVEGAVAVSTFTEQSLLKSSLNDETLGRLGDGLVFPVGVNFSNFFRHDLYRFDGNEITQVDLGPWKIREPSVVETPAAVYLSIMDSSSFINYYPAYVNELDESIHLITYQGDTIMSVFPLNFHQRDSSVYFVYQNQVLRHHPSAEEAELYYQVPAEFNDLGMPYFFAGQLYFSSFGASAFGQELYTVPDLNGDPLKITDFALVTGSASIATLKGVGERLFFAANDGFRGRELWSYQPNCFTIDLAVNASNINWPTGEITASPQGGTPPYAYAWNTGDSTALLSNVSAGFYEVTITDSFGCSISQNTWVETNGVISSTNEDVLNQLSATVFPNPFRDQLTIRFDGPASNALITRIFDWNGRLVTQQKNTGIAEVSLNLANLTKGIYVAQVVTGDGETVLVRQIVKQ